MKKHIFSFILALTSILSFLSSEHAQAGVGYYDDLDHMDDFAIYELTPITQIVHTTDSQDEVMKKYGQIESMLISQFPKSMDCFSLASSKRYDESNIVPMSAYSQCNAVKKDAVRDIDNYISTLNQVYFYKQPMMWTKPQIVTYQIFIIGSSQHLYEEEYIYKLFSNQEIVEFSQKLRAIMYAPLPDKNQFGSMMQLLGFSDQQIKNVIKGLSGPNQKPNFFLSFMPIVDDGKLIPYSSHIAITTVYRECPMTGCFEN